MDIHAERLWQHIQELGKIGRHQDGSVTRLPFTKEDQEAKERIARWMQEAGLRVRVDAVGNVIGTYEGTNQELAPILTGSHFDTVKHGGIFDGCLGLLAGIEALQTMREQGIRPLRTIMVIGFKDEEGNRFGYGMVGSKSICGNFAKEGLQSRDEEGITLYEAMTMAGYQPHAFASCKMDAVHAFYELHIEQGKVLERNHCTIGIVQGISGLARYTIQIYGESNHAGATVMEDRHDPVLGMCHWIQHITKVVTQYEKSVVTIGEIHTYPGVCNVICDHVEFSVDLRSIDHRIMEEIVQEMKACQSHPELRELRIEMVLEQVLAPCPSHPDLCYALEDIAHQEHVSTMTLVSGAGHDCMNFKDVCPVAMIFVPSYHGYSHRKEEYSKKEDCAAGCQVLYRALCEESKIIG